MKFIWALFLTFVIISTNAQVKECRIEEAFSQTLKRVETNHFRILFSIATPSNGSNIQIDSAWITIKSDSASGYLPYYSPHYSFPRTGNKGILFNNQILNPQMKVKGRKDKKSILYQFAIIGINDNYKFKLDIQYDKTCYLLVISKRRGPISYIGTLQ